MNPEDVFKAWKKLPPDGAKATWIRTGFVVVIVLLVGLSFCRG